VVERSFLPYVWMLFGCFSFAWMGQFASLLNERGCDWRWTALARCALATTFAALLARAARAPLVFWRPRVLWLRSLAGSVSMVCTFYAFSRLRTSEVLTLTNTFPIWVALLSWPLLRERPPWAVWPAALCGLAGIALLQRPHFETGNEAIPLALFAAFASAVAMLGLHKVRGVDHRAIVVHFSAVATVFALGACLVGAAPPLADLLDGTNLFYLVGTGATATVGQLFLTRAFSEGAPSRVSVVGLTQILFAMSLDLAFGGPWFSMSTLAGIGLVMLPTAWVMSGKGE
jgi:drug/metabolite transporter (DMT)-like permease